MNRKIKNLQDYGLYAICENSNAFEILAIAEKGGDKDIFLKGGIFCRKVIKEVIVN